MPTVKEAVAVAIVSLQPPRRLLLVRRPEAPGEELPGIWGLPAASLGVGENDVIAIERIGRQKLGAEVRPLRLLAQGQAQRTDYVLVMRLYQALLEGEPRLARTTGADVTLYTDWRWGKPGSLREGAAKGSLCCRLLLDLIPSTA